MECSNSDIMLIDAARQGETAALDELYRQHVHSAYNLARQLARCPADADDLVSEAFSRVFDQLCAGRGPDRAFRAYLLTALRHVAYDRTRHDRKLELAEDVATANGVRIERISCQFRDTALASLERSLVTKAFGLLPERWQAVLWFTAIKGHSPAEVAPMLGLSPNSVAALACRAREGLREAYLRAHLTASATAECGAVHADLGALARGKLANRRATSVRAHLDQCPPCRHQATELAQVNAEQFCAA
jgi:RNA polymerase sigma factor (sigma-70 family)